MSKKEVADWAYEQFTKHGVRKPETYTAKELKYICPDIPTDFIDEHVKTREDSWPRWCPDWSYTADRQTGLSNEYDKNTLCKLL